MILVRNVIAATAAHAGLEPADLIGRSRLAPIVRVRQRAMYVTRQVRPDASLPLVGRILGGRDHTTILHGIRRTEARLQAKDNFEISAVAELCDRLRAAELTDEVLVALHREEVALLERLEAIRSERRARFDELDQRGWAS
jgi:chromosomal replication initiator protein